VLRKKGRESETKNTPGRKDEEKRNRKGYARKRATREEEEGVCCKWGGVASEVKERVLLRTRGERGGGRGQKKGREDCAVKVGGGGQKSPLGNKIFHLCGATEQNIETFLYSSSKR
jgi:hypothetical protein